ncbi:hypothetical protein [Kineococcus sp. SYSU DK018]|uniref:hypothetical protein n=1 Tax=Kineococcus sp. SYSU DK018 TaxID=3383139 RepID=UPI003D7E20E3
MLVRSGRMTGVVWMSWLAAAAVLSALATGGEVRRAGDRRASLWAGRGWPRGRAAVLWVAALVCVVVAGFVVPEGAVSGWVLSLAAVGAVLLPSFTVLGVHNRRAGGRSAPPRQ